MNEFLDQLYGTSDRMAEGDEQEKLAQAQVLDEVLANNGVDINDLSGEELFKVASEIFEEDSAIVKVAYDAAVEEANEAQAAVATEAGLSEDDMAKVAEADFMGRTMAHAFMSEMDELEKDAGVKDMASGAWKATKGGADAAKKYLSSPGKTFKQLRTTGAVNKAGKRPLMGALKGAVRKNRGAAATVAGLGLGAAGAAGLAGKKGYDAMTKENSGLDALVENRAIELLQELGY